MGEQDFWVIVLILVLVGISVLRLVLKHVGRGIDDSARNKKVRRENVENPAQPTRLADIYGGRNTAGTPVQPPQTPVGYPQTARFCSSCGQELSAGARFCNTCGAEVQGSIPLQAQYRQAAAYTQPPVYASPVSAKKIPLSISANSPLFTAAGVCMAAYTLLSVVMFFMHRLSIQNLSVLISVVSAVLFVVFVFTMGKKNTKLFIIPLALVILSNGSAANAAFWRLAHTVGLYENWGGSRYAGLIVMFCFILLLLFFCLTVFGVVKNKWLFVSLCAAAVLIYAYATIWMQALYLTPFLLLGLAMRRNTSEGVVCDAN